MIMVNIFQRMLPKEEKFFELFDKQAAFAVEAAKSLCTLVEKYDSLNEPERKKIILEIKDIEHRSDLVAHEIMARLDKAFITPFDKEDIHQLAILIDDIIDITNTLAGRFLIFNIQKTNKNIISMGKIVCQTVEVVKSMILNLKNTKKTHEFALKVHSLENQADEIFQNSLSALFREEPDAINIVKFKQIYELLEEIPDKCDVVARVIESIAVKHD